MDYKKEFDKFDRNRFLFHLKDGKKIRLGRKSFGKTRLVFHSTPLSTLIVVTLHCDLYHEHVSQIEKELF
jgi:hypothetical protein